MTISDPTIASPVFTAPSVIGPLNFTVVVTDTDGLQSSASVVVNVAGIAPEAVASVSNLAPLQGETGTLDGSASTDNLAGLTYVWRQVGESTVSLINATSAIATFTAPNTVETLSFELTVTDVDGLTDTTTVSVDVTGIAPIVTASVSNPAPLQGEQVTLIANATDNIAVAGYSWSQIAGPDVALSDTQISNPTFTVPTAGILPNGNLNDLQFSIEVVDGDGLSASAEINVRVASPIPLELFGVEELSRPRILATTWVIVSLCH